MEKDGKPISDIKDLILNDNDNDFQKIMNQMLSGGDDIDLKTEISHPFHLTILKSLETYAIEKKLFKTAQTINQIIYYYCRYMISHKRMSRIEIIEGLKALGEKTIKETKEFEVSK